MSEAGRRLAIVAAALAGARAGALLARTAGPEGTEVVALARRLAAAPRAERLRALAAELAADPRTARERAAAAAKEERGPGARFLAAVGTGAAVAAPGRGAAAIVRLCRERVEA